MPAAYQLETDWMLDAKPYAASWHEDPVTGICTLQNGLVARRQILAPNAATIGCRQSDDRCTHPAVHLTPRHL